MTVALRMFPTNPLVLFQYSFCLIQTVMFKLVLLLSLKYFFYYKDSLESLLLELKISQKLREAAAHLSSPFLVSTAVPEESEPVQMCPCCFSHGQAGGISASKFSLGIWLIPGKLAWLELLPPLVSSAIKWAQLCPTTIQICGIFWLLGDLSGSL